MKDMVKISVVLGPRAQSREGADRLRRIATGMGLETMASGRATMSFRMEREAFESVFGVGLEPVPAEAAGERDFGAPPGFTTAGELPVPPELADYVRAISVEPPARRLENTEPGPSNSQKGG